MRYINERFTFLLMWCLYTMWLMVYGSHKALKWWASTWADLHYMVFVPFESDLFRSVHECVARLMVGSGTGAQLTTEASLLLHTACCDQSRLFQTRLRVGVTLRWHHKASMVPHRMTLAIAATCYWVFFHCWKYSGIAVCVSGNDAFQWIITIHCYCITRHWTICL